MEKRGLIGAILFLVVVGAVIFIAGYLIIENHSDKEDENDGEIIVNGTQGTCNSNEDCVPASCCHPSSCTSKTQAPDCSNATCSQVCAPGTLDCGQGACECVNSRCEAVFE